MASDYGQAHYDDDHVGISYREMGDMYDLPDSSFEVVTWSPGQHGEDIPGQQVHLMMYVAEDLHLCVRFKSRDAVDRFIDILRLHRDGAIW